MDFRILGPLEVFHEGRRVEISGPKQRALLAILLLHANEVMSPDRLIDYLWGENPPPTATRTLQAHVSRLRRALSGKDDPSGQRAPLEARGHGYVLMIDPDQLDAERFRRLLEEARRRLSRGEAEAAAERAEQALALWRGPALADLAYESFAQAEIARLEELRLAAVEERMEADLASGRHGELVGNLQRLVAQHPLRERLRGQLMISLYRSNRHAQALQVYEEGRRALAEELGLDPSQDLQRLQRQILEQDPGLSAGVATRPREIEPGPGGRRSRLVALLSAGVLAPSWVRDHRAAVAVVAVAVLAAAAVPLAMTRSHDLETEPLEELAPDSVGLIDVESGSLVASLDLPGRPRSIALGHGAAWVSQPTGDSVSRINTETRTLVDTIPVGRDPAGIAVTRDAVWVTNSGDGTLSRIDPDTSTVVDTIAVGNGPTGVAEAFGSLWVVNAVDGTLARIDPDKRAVTDTVYAGDGPTDVAAGEDALWITNSAGATVSRIDPETMNVVQTYNVGNGPAGLAVLAHEVWVANRLDGTVSRIDRDTNAVTGVPTGGGPGAVAAAGNAIWVANGFDGTISRIEAGDGDTKTISVGNAPSAVAATASVLWVTVGARPPSHAGGTLRIASEGAPPSIDMATAYDELAWALFITTNDGLVGFRRVSGAEGSLLVPDLATSLPRPSDGGTTYTFQIRPRIRYSTGATVAPDDFRRAIERVYTTESDARFLYDGILGTDRCAKDPPECDLSEGIETSKETVTFRLKAPDPEFLYKLAMPFASAVPSRTAGDEVRRPLPATGPYMIQTYDGQEGLVLVRNPRFREWSPLAQPDGYPDRIVWRFGIDGRKAVPQVVAGELDYLGFWDEVPPIVADVMREAPKLAHTYPVTATFYMSLGTTRPPFDDVRVRQALNLAVDRSRLVELWGGPEHARSTCQVLPPGFPGYQPYCPYTVGANAKGRWTGPDLAKAQQLIRESRAEGTSVEVWGFPVPGVGLKVSRYVTELLNTLGFRATHRAFSNVGRYFERLFSEKPQIGIAGWFQDYPAASNFVDPLLSCGADANSTGLCDPDIDRMIDRALELQAVDPARARELWAEIDHRIVDLAPWVPLVNPVRVDIVSNRVGNYQAHAQWHVLMDQLWVR